MMAFPSLDTSDPKYESSHADRFRDLRETTSRVDTAALDSLFNELPPVPLSHLIDTGGWNGGFFDTGHSNGDFMKEICWVGKDFFSLDHVDPVIVNPNGKRESWGKWGFATVRATYSFLYASPVLARLQLKEIVYRGKVTATMVYDERPVFDYFRWVDENTILGIMEGKPLDGPFYFYIVKP